MKPIFYFFVCSFFLSVFSSCAQEKEIRLIVRADDIGSSHTANLACIDVYKDGIARSVEIMVPCPWFLEAVEMLKEVPGYDVGLHITMTSEWENIKWGPVSDAPSLTDENGYFFPTFWPGKNFPEERTFTHSNWTPADVEKEMRAQIDMALKHLPNISHMNFHMGGTSADPKIKEIFDNLAKEYNLMSSVEPYGVTGFRGFGGAKTTDEKISNLVSGLESLKPGTYLFIEHPGYDTPEMQAIGHKGYYGVAKDRDGVTKAWTNEKVMEVIERRNISLIGYADLKE